MEHKKLLDEVLKLAIDNWNKKFTGISAHDIGDKLDITNKEVMNVMESLAAQGLGSLNSNVELYSIKIDIENSKFIRPNKSILTHMFFPDKDLLTEHFYSSNLVREGNGEYKNRLHRGANQIAFVFFSGEVLAKYFKHPELYDVDDSLSGGHILSREGVSKNRYLYIRYGKRKLECGAAVVTAIYRDLCNMSDEEQSYWHSYELKNINFDRKDENFIKFLARTYNGDFVDYKNLIANVSTGLIKVNESFVIGSLFKRTYNTYLKPPVENTGKSLYDSCSELYKLIGPDSLDQKIMKDYLLNQLYVPSNELIHSQSKRPLSSLQLLELIEQKSGIKGLLSKAIREIGKYRIEADHKLTQAVIDNHNHVNIFWSLCEELTSSLQYFARVLICIEKRY